MSSATYYYRLDWGLVMLHATIHWPSIQCTQETDRGKKATPTKNSTYLINISWISLFGAQTDIVDADNSPRFKLYENNMDTVRNNWCGHTCTLRNCTLLVSQLITSSNECEWKVATLTMELHKDDFVEPFKKSRETVKKWRHAKALPLCPLTSRFIPLDPPLLALDENFDCNKFKVKFWRI